MVRTKDELLADIKAVIGESEEDTAIALLENVSDTLDDMSTGEDWKTKYEENDAAWRKKYRDRFYGASDPKEPGTNETIETEESEGTFTFESLFKED